MIVVVAVTGCDDPVEVPVSFRVLREDGEVVFPLGPGWEVDGLFLSPSPSLVFSG
jgi:hypothetical protein